MPTSFQNSNSRRGFFLGDAILGLAILGMISATMIATWHQQHMTLASLAEQREMVRQAEGALTSLQAGVAVSQGDDRMTINFTVHDDESAPDRYVWVRVTVETKRRTVELAGIVPQANLPREARE